MDGTLLDSNHQITQDSLDAIDAAVNAGKTVILSTGRSLSELKDYRQMLKHVRYFICESGALLVDTNTDQIIHSEQIEPSAVRKIIDTASLEKAMIYIASNGQNLATRSYVMRMADFCIGQYQDIFLQTGTLLDDVVASYNKKHFPVEKLNLFSATPELREYFVQALSHLPLEMARAEDTSLELSPKNVSKGSICPFRWNTPLPSATLITIWKFSKPPVCPWLWEMPVRISKNSVMSSLPTMITVDVQKLFMSICSMNNYSFVHIHDRMIRVTRIGMANENNIYTV